MVRGGGYKQIIVVRADLSMSRGKLAAQVAHASLLAYEEAKKIRPSWVDEWIKEGQPKIVCEVDDLEELMKLASKARGLRIPIYVVKDRGLTEVPPGTVTCIGIGPGPRELIDRVTGSLRLLK